MQGDCEEASLVIQARGDSSPGHGVAMEMWKNGRIWALFKNEDGKAY